MLRTALAVTLITAASLGAQSQQPQRLSEADSAAIFAAARAEVARLVKNPNSSDLMAGSFAKRDSTVARTPDEIQLRADTAWVTLWTREDHSGRAGQTVPVARREGQGWRCAPAPPTSCRCSTSPNAAGSTAR